MQLVINPESEHPLQKNLQDLQRTVEARNITQAEDLLAQIKSRIMKL